ncbi:prolyl-tRNA synthetase [bacterium]|jgi:prolyl-tRNA synthetase|nr:prolyl-tRNA synthetase [bacterium]MBT6832186.1 prolyl-tRNA synthetase [bacterium]MBT6996131.1 prolyl-tRNA synthetase [bacterium]MBT7772211.1 prolyl-tRNA synthetase [bacterium]
MRYTQILLKTSKESPSDENAKNAELLIRGGFVQKEMAGVYSYLPLGLRVLRKIENIVREEMNAVGASEVLMPALTPRDRWEKTGRANVDIAFSPTEKTILGWSHEEMATPLVQRFCNSPKDFPKCVFQIQTKFRNEPRAKSGLLRGREFLMKDAYSFHLTQEDFEKYYDVMTGAYHRIYSRLGIGELTKLVAASGGEFSKFSHEFQTISPIGEDEIFWDEKSETWFNAELADQFEKSKKSAHAIEVGNIFPLATKYSDAFKFGIDGTSVIMGCYGIGISRLLGTIVEIFHDENGIVWPKNIAPAQVYLAPIGKDDAVFEKSDALYNELLKEKIEVLYDDRRDKKTGPGTKFADHELLGIPFRVVLSENLLAENLVEIVDRKTGTVKKITTEKLIEFLKK